MVFLALFCFVDVCIEMLTYPHILFSELASRFFYVTDLDQINDLLNPICMTKKVKLDFCYKLIFILLSNERIWVDGNV
jgi:hypothetical protein